MNAHDKLIAAFRELGLSEAAAREAAGPVVQSEPTQKKTSARQAAGQVVRLTETTAQPQWKGGIKWQR